ncbi:hypothetical protein P152DRAFT_455533 [Eremomyces bilateralis CBS 781.70]|uniref:Uncharacterized protein n=1 Tax=Eremomyces bilateralis CBS 781.70 TaxID=1392243 RepID=A0A6G1GCS8_9PEZI|nr:uncharacterized protein P152DRAFT_455533 [Eremomyces bilateralis CBS 781.70]KAF1815812.1 hypothetical protein P152DRAFT_455533 [Eremomyces bilateralis CBS 781.70]
MPWFSSSRSSHSSSHYPSHSHSSSRPAYVRSSAGSSYSRSSTSHYKRRPRDGYIARLLHKLKRLFRELWYYARKHPMKVFFLVIMVSFVETFGR